MQDPALDMLLTGVSHFNELPEVMQRLVSGRPAGALPRRCLRRRRACVFSVTIRDHMMVAHSLQRGVFGPARRQHGATYAVDAAFRSEALDADSIVVDIGRAAQELRTVVSALSYRNLDDEPERAL